jgi:hypothetical protein
LVERIGADILAKVERRWQRKHHELGPCLVWRDGEATILPAGGVYGRIYVRALKTSDLAHNMVWRRCYGSIRRGLDVDHLCRVTLCWPAHGDIPPALLCTRRLLIHGYMVSGKGGTTCDWDRAVVLY